MGQSIGIDSTTFGTLARKSPASTPDIGSPGLMVPPASGLQAATSVAWFVATHAIFHRFYLPVRSSFRYVDFPVGTSSGNVQGGVVALSGANALDFTRVMNSGVVACPATGLARLDCGVTTLPPGDYAVFMWCDNTTATFPHVNASGIAGVRWCTNFPFASGVTASGNLVAWGQRVLIGLTLEADL
jgi:hypothetical protein